MITAGMLTSAVGLLLLSGVAPGGTYVSTVLLGALLSALGMGFSLVPATIVAMQGVERSQSGVASGLLNTSRLVGGALGLAVLSTIAAGQTAPRSGRLESERALTNGFALASMSGARSRSPARRSPGCCYASRAKPRSCGSRQHYDRGG